VYLVSLICGTFFFMIEHDIVYPGRVHDPNLRFKLAFFSPIDVYFIPPLSFFFFSLIFSLLLLFFIYLFFFVCSLEPNYWVCMCVCVLCLCVCVCVACMPLLFLDFLVQPSSQRQCWNAPTCRRVNTIWNSRNTRVLVIGKAD